MGNSVSSQEQPSREKSPHSTDASRGGGRQTRKRGEAATDVRVTETRKRGEAEVCAVYD